MKILSILIDKCSNAKFWWIMNRIKLDSPEFDSDYCDECPSGRKDPAAKRVLTLPSVRPWESDWETLEEFHLQQQQQQWQQVKSPLAAVEVVVPGTQLGRGPRRNCSPPTSTPPPSQTSADCRDRSDNSTPTQSIDLIAISTIFNSLQLMMAPSHQFQMEVGTHL